MAFEAICPGADSEDYGICQTFIEDNGGTTVVLDLDCSTLIPHPECNTDDGLSAILFSVSFDAAMLFYRDDAFSVLQSGISDPFVIGNDRVCFQSSRRL